MKTKAVNRAGARRILAGGLCGVLLAVVLIGSLACSAGESGQGSGTSSTMTSGMGGGGSSPGGRPSGEVEGLVGEDIELGEAVVTVRALQPTFQPADPVQRLSPETPVAPADNESFYQAFVRILNRGVPPLRVDPQDFTLLLGGRVHALEPTRSGPAARSLLKNASLDLLLTFKGEAGQQPVLLYSPEWFEGTLRVSLPVDTTTTTR